MMSDGILTSDVVRDILMAVRTVVKLRPVDEYALVGWAERLADSHEALRAEVERLEAACKRKDDDLAEISHCICHEGYKSRGTQDPACHHDYAEEVGKR